MISAGGANTPPVRPHPKTIPTMSFDTSDENMT